MDSQNLNKSQRTAMSKPFVWANIALIAVVPWLVVESMAGLAVGDPVFPEWFEILLLGIPAIALVTWQQWQQPIYPFSLWFLAKPQETLTNRELKILALVKQHRNGWYATGLIALSVAGVMLLLFSKIYGAAPLAEAIAPFPSGLRLLGVIWAEIFWLASNFVLQSGIAALRIQLTAETELDSLQPISVDKVKNSFTILGWRSPKILQFLENLEEQTNISQTQEVNKEEDIPEVNSAFSEEVAIAFTENAESFDAETNSPEFSDDVAEILVVELLEEELEITEEVQEVAIVDIIEEVFEESSNVEENETEILEITNEITVTYGEFTSTVVELLDNADTEVLVTENQDSNPESKVNYEDCISDQVLTPEDIHNIDVIESLGIDYFDLNNQKINEQDLPSTDLAIANSEENLQEESPEPKKSLEKSIEQETSFSGNIFTNDNSVKKENSFLQKNSKFSVSKKKKGFGKPIKIEQEQVIENLKEEFVNEPAPSCLIQETLLDQFLEKIEEINKSDRNTQKINSESIASDESANIASTTKSVDEFADLEELLDRKFSPTEVEE